MFDRPAFNDAGQAVVTATLRGTGSDDNRGLFFYDPILGPTTVIREDNPLPLLGGAVGSNVVFTATGTTDTPVVGDEGMGLNNHGQVAFWVDLSNNEQAVVRWTGLPEPESPVLLGLGGMAPMFVSGRFRISFQTSRLRSDIR